MNALVTGGSGYLGTGLIERLHARGVDVANFDLVKPDESPADVRFVPGDIRDREAIRAACEGVDVVYHAVAQQPLAKDPALIEGVNVDGTANLLAAARAAKVSKIVYVSSTAVFGIPEHNPVTEGSPLRPLEPYGRSKVRGEMICRESMKAGLDVTIIRPRTIVGGGRLGLFSMLFDWVAEGSAIYVLGRGDNRTHFIHPDDLVDACVRAGDREGPAVYNIGSADVRTMREMLQGLADHAGTGSKVRSLPMRPAILGMRILSTAGLAPFAPYHWLLYGESLWYDVSRARTELGWDPKYSNAAMIAEAYEWFTARRGTLRHDESRGHSLVREGALRLLRRLG